MLYLCFDRNFMLYPVLFSPENWKKTRIVSYVRLKCKRRGFDISQTEKWYKNFVGNLQYKKELIQELCNKSGDGKNKTRTTKLV